ncbi:MAG: hypothetical protein ACE1ZI_07095 [Acidobacteriota bacterium]
MKTFSLAALFLFELVALASYGAGLAPIQETPDSPGADRSSGFLTDAEGQPLPLESYEEIVHFLNTARVVSSKQIGDGVTGARKVLLEKDGLRVNAVFRNVRINESRTLPTGTQVAFRDDYIFECAAYELSRLLGLDNIPPTVEREIQGQKGSLQLWIEGGVTETDRRDQGYPLLDEETLRLHWQVMLVFDNLIFNDDRNRGNYLYDQKGKLWMIDHTRSFRTDEELPYPSGILYSEHRLWEGLQKLESAVMRTHLQKYLGPSELESLIKRKDRLVEYIQEMITERGEEDVLFSF